MSLTVKVDIPSNAGDEVIRAARRGLAKAGEMLEAEARSRAPWEPVPRHGQHLRDTSYSRLLAERAGGDAVEVGFSAFWASWQHEDLTYQHEVGEAKFLERAMVENAEQALQLVAAAIRQVLA